MLYVTYNNTDHTDGAGAQIQRILLIYLTAKHFGIGYIHSPIVHLDYQGLKCLEDNMQNNTILEDFNTLIDIPSDRFETIDKVFTTKVLTYSILSSLKDTHENILLKTTYCDTIDRGIIPNFQSIVQFPWIHAVRNQPIIVAVHIRRGELLVVDAERMLPNSYYIEIMNELSKLFQEANIPFEFHIHTEVITKTTVVTPSHHGILDRIQTNITLVPGCEKLDEFQSIPNIQYHINEYPVKTLQDLTNSDILLASRSSFSYVAAMLKKKGIVLFHPFWHTLSDNWIPTKTAQDIRNNRDRIVSEFRI